MSGPLDRPKESFSGLAVFAFVLALGSPLCVLIICLPMGYWWVLDALQELCGMGALILAWLLSPVSFACGVVALVRIRRHRARLRGTWLAVSAVVLSTLNVIVVVAVVVNSPWVRG